MTEMSKLDLLEKIRPKWLDVATNRLARGEEMRKSFATQLNHYFSLFEQAITTGDPGWMDSILDEWLEAQTHTDLDRREPGLLPILTNLLITTYDISQDILSDAEAVELIGMAIPVHNYTVDYIHRHEINLKIKYISDELEKAYLTLERLDKSKSNFISVAAHELKTPLTLIEGYIAMLEERLPKDDQDLHHMMLLLNGVNNGTQRLREIVGDMIDVSRIDNDMLSLNYQPIWINRIFTVVYEELKEALKKRDLVYEMREFNGSNEMIYGDPERLYQAFRNLMVNAIKYTPDGGRIIIGGRKLPGFLEITVTDTGIGIDPEDHELIFQKFDRLGDPALHSSGKTKFKGGGPGLGLPIAKGLIEAHQGTIWVESDGHDEINCPGATFHVLLPLLKELPGDMTVKLYRESADKQVLTFNRTTRPIG